MIKIDDYSKEKQLSHINLLKIDTQGFEDEVLKGAINLIQSNKIDLIELELIIESPYDRSLLFSDIENILLPHGYRLFGIENGGNLKNTYDLSFDLLFVNEKIYKKARCVPQ